MNNLVQPQEADPKKEQEEVAVVGMACTFPQAPDLKTYWRNIINKVDAITDVPQDRWDKDRFFDPNVLDGSKIYSTRGGYLPSPFRFDAAEFGIMPKAVEGGEPDQFMVLKTAADAMRDAGIETGSGHEKTEFILGRGSYLSPGALNLLQRTFIVDQTIHLLNRLHKGLSSEDLQRLKADLLTSLKPFQSDNAPSIMPNISAGRVANRLGFMGPNYIIDAACASSLYAVDAAVAGLLSGKSDLALAGGVHIFNNIPFLSVFCALGAMSRQDDIRPFDKNADGLLPGEGVGLVVLKRKSDALRDGNRIYAVIKSVGTSSDGRGISVAAPRVEGEVLALKRAFQKCNISPETIGLIEAHGTATKVGDVTEIQSLTEIFGTKNPDDPRYCAVGSVKSMIGHTMPAAGIASFIKTALALYYKVLPPTLNCDEPNPKFELEKTPFYINTQTRPWIKTARDIPRRAGVNAFGFGGVNAHVIMEEHGSADEPLPLDWDSELFLFSGDTQADLFDRCQDLLKQLEINPDRNIQEISRALISNFETKAHRLSIISDSVQDLVKKLQYTISKLEKPNCKKIKDIKGIYYFSKPLGKNGKIAFMFPGEGSAYTNMMLDLCLNFPEVRACYDEFNSAVASRSNKSRLLPTQFIFPATLLTRQEEKALEAEFWKVDSGLQAILPTSLAMNTLLGRFGLQPDMIVGHSAGEYSAWLVSGILDKAELFEKQEKIAGIYTAHRPSMDTAMTAVSTHYDKVRPLLENVSGDLYISNDNCPHQVMVVGEVEAMAEFTRLLKEKKIMYTDLPSKEVHHTPMAKDQAESLSKGFSDFNISKPVKPTYSAVVASPYPAERKDVLDLMVAYWLKPLQFRKTVENMHDDGARIFIEVGPGTNLSGFVDDTLRGKPFVTIPTSNPRRSGMAQLCHVLGLLVAHHVPVSLEYYQQSSASQIKQTEVKRPKNKKTTIDLNLGIRELNLESEQINHWQKSFTPVNQPEKNPAQKTQPQEQQMPKAGKQQEATVQTPRTTNTSGNTQPSARTQVMQKYLENMERFLLLQKQTMGIMTTGSKPMSRPKVALPSFVDRVIQMTPRKQCRVQRVIDLKKDIFLYDHPFGGGISNIDDNLFPLIITPLTLNIEMMAEAAAILNPGKTPIEIKNIKASRWIVVEEDQGTCLEAEACMVSDTEVNVKLYNMSKKAICSAEATVILSGQYPPSAVTNPFSTKDIQQDAVARAREIYTQKYMTHGRRFQPIAAVDWISEKAISAYIKTPSVHNLFAGQPTQSMILNPMLMDACAQLTGFWAQKALKEGFITFPAGARNIRFLAPAPKSGELLHCTMRIREINSSFVLSDLEFTRSNGRLWAVVQGWTHRRFELPAELYGFYKFPHLHMVSNATKVQQDAQPSSVPAFQCRVGYYEALNRTIWKKAIGYLYLSRSERKVYQEKISGQGDADKWLAARMATKDAVRLFLNRTRRLNMFPADIEIIEKENSRYIPKCSGLPELDRELMLSVSFADKFATAIVSEAILNNEQERVYNA